MQRVMVVDDDRTLSELVGRYLERAGYAVELIADGALALERALADPPDLAILDLMLPGLNGLEVCRRLRASAPVPVIMLTALGEETDRIAGLEVGADDYAVKPFSLRELVLRVQSVLRRAAGPVTAGPPETLTAGPLRVDVAAREAWRGAELLTLTAREFDLLVFLLRHPRQAFDRRQLLEQVWGWSFGDAATVTVHVRRLREKIEDDPARPTRIVTVWGVGYRFDPEPVGSVS